MVKQNWRRFVPWFFLIVDVWALIGALLMNEWQNVALISVELTTLVLLFILAISPLSYERTRALVYLYIAAPLLPIYFYSIVLDYFFPNWKHFYDYAGVVIALLFIIFNLIGIYISLKPLNEKGRLEFLEKIKAAAVVTTPVSVIPGLLKYFANERATQTVIINLTLIIFIFAIFRCFIEIWVYKTKYPGTTLGKPFSIQAPDDGNENSNKPNIEQNRHMVINGKLYGTTGIILSSEHRNNAGWGSSIIKFNIKEKYKTLSLSIGIDDSSEDPTVQRNITFKNESGHIIKQVTASKVISEGVKVDLDGVSQLTIEVNANNGDPTGFAKVDFINPLLLK